MRRTRPVGRAGAGPLLSGGVWVLSLGGLVMSPARPPGRARRSGNAVSHARSACGVSRAQRGGPLVSSSSGPRRELRRPQVDVNPSSTPQWGVRRGAGGTRRAAARRVIGAALRALVAQSGPLTAPRKVRWGRNRAVGAWPRCRPARLRRAGRTEESASRVVRWSLLGPCVLARPCLDRGGVPLGRGVAGPGGLLGAPAQRSCARRHLGRALTDGFLPPLPIAGTLRPRPTPRQSDTVYSAGPLRGRGLVGS